GAESEQRGLAATGWPQDRAGVPFGQGERDVVEDREGPAARAVDAREVLDAKRCCQFDVAADGQRLRRRAVLGFGENSGWSGPPQILLRRPRGGLLSRMHTQSSPCGHIDVARARTIRAEVQRVTVPGQRWSGLVRSGG